MSDPFRCGFIAFVGRPNVGKSTLTNALIGSKISIVSRKAQTTRHRIHGVLTRDHEQFVFVDTPGFQTRHGGAMNRMMNRVVTQALAPFADLQGGLWQPQAGLIGAPPGTAPWQAAVVALATQAGQADRAESQSISSGGTTVLLRENLLTEIGSRLPEGEAMFEADTLTDRPMRFIAAELVREKIFRLVGDELPYGCTVIIEQWEETDKGVRVAACVIVERESHRPILLGAGGAHMKRIASEARHDMTQRPYSILRPVLSMFQPLELSWSGVGEVKTLTRAECAGIWPLTGRAYMSAWYMNELLLRLLPREDPHKVLFDAYHAALAHLAQGTSAAGALRRFEWILLAETGYGVEQPAPDFDDARAEPDLRASLRERLDEQLSGRPLLTRKVLMELQRY